MWLDRPEQKSSNPAQKFLEWKSDDKCFSYYDKEKEKNVKVELPLKVVILEHYHTVKGWDDKTESNIYSNEVFAIGTDPVTVKSFGSKKADTKGRKIAEGLYKDIKNEVKAEGGHYCRSIYAVTTDQELINISLKGSSVRSYSDFIQDFGDNNFDKNWIEITEAKEMKKGKVTYSVPVFKKSAAIKDKSKLQPFAETLGEYMNEYLNDTPPNRDNSAVDAYEADKETDDIPF